MKRNRKQPLTLTLNELQTIIDMCGNNGHSILKTDALATVNNVFVSAVTRTYHSDGSHKGSITDSATGRVVDDMTGVYTLDVLRMACRVIPLDTTASERFSGRGFTARALTGQLLAFVDMMKACGFDPNKPVNMIDPSKPANPIDSARADAKGQS